MAFSLTKLFPRNEKPSTPAVNVLGTTQTGDLVVAKNVNWKHEGISAAGTSNGNVTSFNAGFTACFNAVRQSQALDKQLQDEMKMQLNTEKIALEGQLKAEQGKQEMAQQKLDGAKQQVTHHQRILNEALGGNVNKEKTVRLNFLIGVTIIALLTIYLFIFYSSTAYSAFFRNFDVNDSLSVAMFDGNAVVDAFRASFFEGCFCLFMPVIFLALGYVAHGFSTNSKGFERYFKTALIYVITFVFDALMAYKISKGFYDTKVVLYDYPPYSIKIAATSEDFWMVIFCGFVSYVIWGLVFGFVMDCYDRITNNKHELATLQQNLNDAQADVAKNQTDLSAINQKIAELDAEIKKKDHQLQNNVRYDVALIKKSLADYYQGWVSYYALASIDTAPLQSAYNQEMVPVDSWIKNNA